MDLRELDDTPENGTIAKEVLAEALFQKKTSRTGFEPVLQP